VRQSSDFKEVPSNAPKTKDLRRVPTQERSKRRFEAIVTAAAERFAADGFDGTTMEAIAAAAGTSIGSVYQFFKNKRAVFKAVALACLDRSAAAFGRLLGPDSLDKPWKVLVDEAVDGFAALQQDDVMWRAMWRNIHLYEDYAAEDEAMVRAFVAQIAGLLALWMPTMSLPHRTRVASVMVQTTSALLFVAGRGDGPIDCGLVDETKLMLRRYLAPYVEGSPSKNV
jgi:AcrR family transcriptional regulator